MGISDDIYMYHETCYEECPENCNSTWYTYKKLNNASMCINEDCKIDIWYKDDNITIRCGNMAF